VVVAALLAVSLYATGSLFGSSEAKAATLSPQAVESMVTLKDKEAKVYQAEQEAAALAAAEEAAEQAQAEAEAAAAARAQAEADAAAAAAAKAEAEAAAQAAIEAAQAAQAALASIDVEEKDGKDWHHKDGVAGEFDGKKCDKDGDGVPDTEGATLSFEGKSDGKWSKHR
jgi:hypothetical protein